LRAQQSAEATPRKVIVVEDDAASADVLQRRLEANGMLVSVGRDGAEGLSLVRKIHPDLVLLDVMLPDTNGYDVCLRIKSDRTTADIPVIFLSARGDVYDKVRGLSSGAVDYLTKPFHPAELLARIDAVLRDADARAEQPSSRDHLLSGPRPTAAIAVSDAAHRTRLERLLADRFASVDLKSERADVLFVDDAAAEAAASLKAAAVIRMAAGEADAVRLDGNLLEVIEVATRHPRLRMDVAAATDALVVLAAALEAHDRSSPHGERVAARAVAIANVLGLDESSCETVRLGALLRDVGNARLPAALLASTELTAEERGLIQQHPVLGADLLARFSPLAHVLPIIRSHHEQLDGSGYPARLRGEQIPLEVRIVTVADRFEALLVDRPDRPALPAAEAVRLLQSSVGKGELDPAVMAALASIVRNADSRGS
jgi:response regulator RpfG family c-di-GMP phosphodiesterase